MSGMHPLAVFRSRFIRRFLHFQKHRDDWRRPMLSLLFERFEFSQKMGVAARMIARQLVVRPPKVMHQLSHVIRQDAGTRKALGAPLGTVTVMGVSRRGCHMNPVCLASAPHAGFIGMEHGCRTECVADFINAGCEQIRTFCDASHDGPCTGAVAEKVFTNFRHPFAGNHLADMKIGHCGLNAGAILHWSGDVTGECCAYEFAAMGASLALCQKFGDEHLDAGQIENLPFFLRFDRLIGQVTSTLRAGVERQVDGLIGGFAGLKGLTRMSGLATGFAPGVLLPQGFVTIRTVQSVARRRFAAVAAVFVEAGFQFRNALLLMRNDDLKPGNSGFKFGDDPTDNFNHGINSALVEGGLDDGA